jgi:hypothetical protein
MNRIFPTDLAAFARKYRFTGGRLRRVKLTHGPRGELTAELRLSVRTTADVPVRLRLKLTGVQEYRFQKRPGAAGGRVPEARFGHFGDAVFVNLDAWGLQPGEVPKVHDFRGSDAYIAGRDLFWEEVPPR